MKVTRVIAVGVILGSLAIGALNAQALRNSTPPAEFPPASFKGKQYVDSRGCIYIRAGIDGNVTWVPRVSRTRKQVCGYKPTAVAGARPAPPPPAAGNPVIITATPPATSLASTTTTPTQAPVAVAPAPQPKPSPAPAATVIAAPVPAAAKPAAAPAPAPRAAAAASPRRKPSAGPAPTVITSSKPAAAKPAAASAPRTTPVRAAQRKPSPGPAPTVITSSSKPAAAKPVAAPAPRATAALAPRAKPSPGPKPTVVSSSQPPAPKPAAVQAQPQASNCSNASAFSQQYINNPGGRFSVRCGPQDEAPVSYGQSDRQSSAIVNTDTRIVHADTRVVPHHVNVNRQNTTNVSVPSGYKTVWKDDRLNPQRAERTLRPAQVRTGVAVPSGYKPVNRRDDRLNPNRGLRTAQGQVQTEQIWSNTVPRKLLTVPIQSRRLTIPAGSASVQASDTVVRRLSTRSSPANAPTTGNKRIYVRVAIYTDEGDARTTARALARTGGWPMVLATDRSSGKKAVLVGPFTSKAEAKLVLAQVKNAGFRRARLSR